jgi:hypothetical protein
MHKRKRAGRKLRRWLLLAAVVTGILAGLFGRVSSAQAAGDPPAYPPWPASPEQAPSADTLTGVAAAPASGVNPPHYCTWHSDSPADTGATPSVDLSVPFAPVNPVPVSEMPVRGDALPPGPALPTDAAPPACAPAAPVLPEHHPCWPEVWGFVGLDLFFTGRRTAPNGLPYAPLFDANSELNLGLLPHKKLYLFIDLDFWTQRATDGITNPHQGSFDFSKRELDILAGFAWNYWGPLELRLFGYADNNLNRGISPEMPFGFNDGVGVENRYYLPAADPYDVGRQSFLGIGYLPSKTLVGLDGQQFTPGLFLHGYLTWDIPWRLPTYVYLDGQYFGESGARPRLLLFEAGLAVRPISRLQGLEFRLGGSDTYDVEVRHSRGLIYGAARLQF